MSSGGEDSGTKARTTSTKLSDSTHATLPCSASTQDPISTVVIFQKRRERLIRFSILYRTTWIPSRKRRPSRSSRATCRERRRLSPFHLSLLDNLERCDTAFLT